MVFDKKYDNTSVFSPENLLREARRQKSLNYFEVPKICVLDPDGDIVKWLKNSNLIQKEPDWACYHTELYTFKYDEITYGIIGCAVGASFAVLVAEELFVSGCELLISVTSAGQILPIDDPPYFVLIEKALRDEGTSYHYLPPSDFIHISPKMLSILNDNFSNQIKIHYGSSWTTDAPFRETVSDIEHCKNLGIATVEMEAAALYAFSEAKKKAVVCFAHVTNQMACQKGDFEKGEENGSLDALKVIAFTANSFMTQL